MPAYVTVVPHLHVESFKDSTQPLVFCPVLPLREALLQVYDNTAPLLQTALVYNPEDGLFSYEHETPEQPRLSEKGDGLQHLVDVMGYKVLFQTIFFDIDAEDGGLTPTKAATHEWRKDQYKRFSGLPDGYAWYATRGGYRLFWELPFAHTIDQFVKLWTDLSVHLATILAGPGSNCKIDQQCKDWTRLYYLPFIRKKGKDGKVQDLRFDHDFEEIGVLNWAPPTLFPGLAEAFNDDGFQLPETLGEGGRNGTLFKYACSLRGRGADEDALTEALHTANEERCDPMLPESEIDKIVQSVVTSYDAGNGRYYEPDIVLPITRTGEPIVNLAQITHSAADFVLGDEVELANRALKELEAETEGTPCVFDRGELHKYLPNRGYWATLNRNDLTRFVSRWSGSPVQAGTDQNGVSKSKPLKIDARKIKGVIQLAHAYRSEPDFFDNQRLGVLFENGFVEPAGSGISLRKVQPTDRALFMMPYDFKARQKPVMFIKFLEDLFQPDGDDIPRKIEAIREFLGCALLGCAPKLQRALLLVGTGANGKSALLEIMASLFPMDTKQSVPPQTMSDGAARASLQRARLNVVEEMPRRALLDAESFKALISGSALQANPKYEAPFYFKPVAAHAFAANALPVVSDNSDGFWRRWILISFNRKFSAQEQDRYIADRISSQESGLIASWAIEAGAAALARGQYTLPLSSTMGTAAWRTDSNTSLQFLLSFLTEKKSAEGVSAPSKELYSAYSQWCMVNGFKAKAHNGFSRDAKNLGVEVQRKKGNRLMVIPSSAVLSTLN